MSLEKEQGFESAALWAKRAFVSGIGVLGGIAAGFTYGAASDMISAPEERVVIVSEERISLEALSDESLQPDEYPKNGTAIGVISGAIAGGIVGLAITKTRKDRHPSNVKMKPPYRPTKGPDDRWIGF